MFLSKNVTKVNIIDIYIYMGINGVYTASICYYLIDIHTFVMLCFCPKKSKHSITLRKHYVNIAPCFRRNANRWYWYQADNSIC